MRAIRSLRGFVFALACIGSGGTLLAAVDDDLREANRLHRAGQSAAALQRADVFLAARPRDAQMRFLKSVILADLGRRDEAAAILTQLAQDYPELAEPHNNLAALHAAAGQWDAARVELLEALRRSPADAAAQENLGDVYLMLAAESYGRAQRAEPANGAIARKISQVRQFAASAPAAASGAAPR